MGGATAGRPDGEQGTGHDQTVEAVISFLDSEGAAGLAHAGGRPLLDHLVGTYEIVRRWDQPPRLQLAALIHSVYGTDVYDEQLLPLSRRGDVAGIAGDAAERLAYLFCVTPRDLLFAGTHVWVRGRSSPPAGEHEPDGQPEATRAELDELVLLHMANLAEQSRSEDGSPDRWLVRLRDLAELLIDSDAVALPLFIAGLAAFSEADELLTLRAYRAGVGRAVSRSPDVRANQMALAAATCPVVGEPCLWLAHLSRLRGDQSEARAWAQRGRRRLLDLGTAWDTRLSFEEWLRLAELLEQATERELPEETGETTDPRTLFEAVARANLDLVPRSDSPMPIDPEDPSPEAGIERFHRYVDAFADTDGPAPRAAYPDLNSQPWFDPARFPLAAYLESNYDRIRDEILGLESSQFHRESERIRRSGEWDVAFLYERGRRRDEVCNACPVTTRGIESHSAMRTVGGLIYVSRMRPGTHIQAHRGPTNLRVRCHLGISVPDGDCALRVGEETRRWPQGECLVFDDYFEHEAWNHTDEDRIVLIVDMWHPALSPTEVRLLQGLHTYAYRYARQLNRYWSSNAAAAATRASNDSDRPDGG
jgi:aspartyl/asparaginyl beta-hydroxylase (cupin superfamily)